MTVSVLIDKSSSVTFAGGPAGAVTTGRFPCRSIESAYTERRFSAGPAIEAERHALSVQLPAEVLQIDGDPTRLSQVFQNLLNNAAKYTPAGGQISLRSERSGNLVTVTVRDNGIGIPEALQPRVFELFTRVHPEQHIKTSGLGIGLALAKQLVELHGGRLELRSEGTGAGSEFIVCLPLRTQGTPLKAVGAEAATHANRAGQRVLVVDDNEDSADSLAMLLQFGGHVVRVANDGASALTSFEQFRPETVLLDIGLPDVDGYEVARRIRASPSGAETVLIALTGWGQLEDKRRAVKAGFDEHLTKPVDLQVLTMLLTTPRATS